MRSGESPLRPRLLSALVLAPVALGVAVLGSWPFALALALLLIPMAVEWRRLTRTLLHGRGSTVAAGLALAIALATLVLAAVDQAGAALVLLLAGAAVGLVGAWLVRAPVLWPPLGVLYLGLPALALVWLRGLPEIGVHVLVWLLLVVWATDIAAFFAGRHFGGPRLAPVISPKKTWSGLLGGIVGAGLAGAAAAAAAGSERLLLAGALGGALAIVAQLGDLTESALKRHAGVKDSGALIPGHGGVLDRLDGLLFAAPALALLGLVLGPRAWPWP